MKDFPAEATLATMSSANLPNKRRRVEQAASTLSKPFKSPLRRAPPTQSTLSAEVDRKTDAQTVQTPVKAANSESIKDGKPSPDQTAGITTPAHKAQRPSPADGAGAGHHPKPGLTQSSTALKKAPPTVPSPQAPIRTTTKTTALHPADPIISDLQKQQRQLQARLATLRSELDTAQQALRIESSTKDGELARLIVKWRSVSQEAAEEVFQGATERIQRMGGMKAWKERMTNQARSSWWDQQGEVCEVQNAGREEDADPETREWFDSLDEEEAESWKAELMGRSGFPLERGRQRTGINNGDADTEEDEVCSRLPQCLLSLHATEGALLTTRIGQAFTMDMMLKTMNIDLKIIGFDPACQRWIKDE